MMQRFCARSDHNKLYAFPSEVDNFICKRLLSRNVSAKLNTLRAGTEMLGTKPSVWNIWYIISNISWKLPTIACPRRTQLGDKG